MNIILFMRDSEWSTWEFFGEYESESKALERIDSLENIPSDMYEYMVVEILSRIPKQKDTRTSEEIKREHYTERIERLQKMDWRPLTENEELFIAATKDYLEGRREEPPESGRLVL